MKKKQLIQYLKDQIEYVKKWEGPQPYGGMENYDRDEAKQAGKIEAYEDCLARIEDK